MDGVTDVRVETVSDRLKAIEADLIRLTHACNRDESYEAASRAQNALQVVAGLRDTMAEFGLNEWEWAGLDG